MDPPWEWTSMNQWNPLQMAPPDGTLDPHDDLRFRTQKLAAASNKPWVLLGMYVQHVYPPFSMARFPEIYGYPEKIIHLNRIVHKKNHPWMGVAPFMETTMGGIWFHEHFVCCQSGAGSFEPVVLFLRMMCYKSSKIWKTMNNIISYPWRIHGAGRKMLT